MTFFETHFMKQIKSLPDSSGNWSGKHYGTPKMHGKYIVAAA